MNPYIENLLSLYRDGALSVQDLAAESYRLGLEHGGTVWKILSPDQEKKLTEWKRDQDAKFAAKQGKKNPYYGAIGGAYIYSYCPTSLGCAISIKNDATGEELDLTDYEEW